MATIPIEVIVQDGPSPEPTPTPSDSGETNIVVPDTGAGTVENGSNGGGIGSAVSIILPAIILVLAIGAIVALLIRRQQGRKNNTNTDISKKEKLAATVSGTIAILAATVLVGNLVIPATNAATSVEPGTAELETEDKITIVATRESDSDTVTATVKDTSYATANLDFGYKVTASMAEGLTNANLYLDGDETSEYYIAPVTNGTLADNTWGYTLAEPSEESSYLSIPLSTKPTNIVKEIAKTAEDKSVDIYYTVQIGKDMPNGTYTGELEYTLSPAIEYMQDFATLSEEDKTKLLASMPEEITYTLKDKRDEQDYTIAKLKDGRIWMTKNLNLAGKTPLYGETSDVPSESNEEAYYILPASSSHEDFQNLYNSNNTDCSVENQPCYSYYSWVVATAGDKANTLGGNDSLYSICPKGWKLPNSSESVSNKSDFYRLGVAYGMNPQGVFDYYSDTSSNFYNQAGPGTVANFYRSGGYKVSGPGFSDDEGYYHASTLYQDDVLSMGLDFSERIINTSHRSPKTRNGKAVRCLVR